MKRSLFYFLGILILFSCQNNTVQNKSDEEVLAHIFKEASLSTISHQNLKYLTQNFPERLACYPQSIEVAKWTKEIMEQMNLDKVFLQEAKVQNWKRGDQEIGIIKFDQVNFFLSGTTLDLFLTVDSLFN